MMALDHPEEERTQDSGYEIIGCTMMPYAHEQWYTREHGIGAERKEENDLWP